MKLTKDEARKYGIRSGKTRRAQETWLIEGDRVTVADIAARLGLNRGTAHSRLAKARKSEGPVTWEALGGVSPP